MKSKELEQMLELALKKMSATRNMLFSYSDHELDEPNEKANEALNALKAYLSNSDDMIEWAKTGVPEGFISISDDDLEADFSAIELEIAKKMSDCPQKDYGKFCEENVIELLNDNGTLSTSLLQRRFKIGYGRSATMISDLAEKGIIIHDKHGKWIKNPYVK